MNKITIFQNTKFRDRIKALCLCHIYDWCGSLQRQAAAAAVYIAAAAVQALYIAAAAVYIAAAAVPGMGEPSFIFPFYSKFFRNSYLYVTGWRNPRSGGNAANRALLCEPRNLQMDLHVRLG